MAKRGAGLRLLATYWPYREASHRPPTGHKGAAIGGRPSHRPSLATYSPSPHRPIEAFGRDGQKQGSPPYTDLLTGHLLATYGQRGHTTHWPPTGHLRPTWPSEAFGHLLPPHRPIEAFGREASPLPRLSGAVA